MLCVYFPPLWIYLLHNDNNVWSLTRPHWADRTSSTIAPPAPLNDLLFCFEPSQGVLIPLCYGKWAILPPAGKGWGGEEDVEVWGG